MLPFNNKQIFFAQNVSSEPVNPCTLWDLVYAGTDPCYEFEDEVLITGVTVQASSLTFKPDGTKFYVTDGPFNSFIREYDMNTAWDITAGYTLNQTRTFTEGGDYVNDCAFSPDGTILVTSNRNSNDGRRRTYILSSAWDISTAVFSGVSTLDTLYGYVTSFVMQSGGTVGFGFNSSWFIQYDFSTPWDASTSTRTAWEYHIGEAQAGTGGIWVRGDGLRMYTGAVGQYNLSSSWDISTITAQAGIITQSSEDGFWMKEDGTRFYVMNGGYMRQYNYAGV